MFLILQARIYIIITLFSLPYHRSAAFCLFFYHTFGDFLNRILYIFLGKTIYDARNIRLQGKFQTQ
jgi:hypothetical protein